MQTSRNKILSPPFRGRPAAKGRGIHFIGIGGIGTSALARYYLEMGYQVCGSDLVDSEIIESLKKLGAKIFIGKHKAGNLPENLEKVIYSPAIKPDNPELKKAKKLGLKCQSYPEALGELTQQYYTIAVSGTHGKSTTAAMIALILIKAGLNPTVIIGTKLREWGNSNFRMGKTEAPRASARDSQLQNFSKACAWGGTPHQRPIIRKPPLAFRCGGKYLVIEADEWQASFLNYWPKIIVLTNIEKEHLDYYKNLEHILKTYKEYIGHLSKDGALVVNRDDKNIRKIVRQGFAKSLSFSLKQAETQKIKKILKLPGEHNVANGLAALTTARVLGIEDKISFQALSEYKGSWRRFELSRAELRGTKRRTTRKITIVNDYAHHPTEIEATLKSIREKWPNKKIWCVFQPHQYQRTFYLFNDFVRVFQDATRPASRGREAGRIKPIDKIIITDIYDVAGRENEKIKQKVNSQKLIKAINRGPTSGKHPEVGPLGVLYLAKDKIISYLKKNLKDNEVVILMGAGDIYDLNSKLSTPLLDKRQ